MTNTLILNTILEESADYSKLIANLTGSYVAEDQTVDAQGQELEEPIEHPHKALVAPDFSGHIRFAHFTNDYEELAGVSHVVASELNTSKVWNESFAFAKENGYSHLVVLNGVTSINPHIISLAIENYGDKDIVNISDGGAFIINCSSNFSANEEYKLWFADNQILLAAAESGSYARNDESFVELSQAEITTNFAAVNEAIQADIALHESK